MHENQSKSSYTRKDKYFKPKYERYGTSMSWLHTILLIFLRSAELYQFRNLQISIILTYCFFLGLTWAMCPVTSPSRQPLKSFKHKRISYKNRKEKKECINEYTLVTNTSLHHCPIPSAVSGNSCIECLLICNFTCKNQKLLILSNIFSDLFPTTIGPISFFKTSVLSFLREASVPHCVEGCKGTSGSSSTKCPLLQNGCPV